MTKRDLELGIERKRAISNGGGRDEILGKANQISRTKHRQLPQHLLRLR